MTKIWEWVKCPYNWLIAAWCAAVAYLASYNRGVGDIIATILISLNQPFMLFMPLVKLVVFVFVVSVDWVRKRIASGEKIDLETIRESVTEAAGEVLEEVGK